MKLKFDRITIMFGAMGGSAIGFLILKFDRITIMFGAMGGSAIGFLIWVFVTYAV